MDASVPIKDMQQSVAVPVNSMPNVPKTMKFDDSDSDGDDGLPLDALADNDSEDEDFGKGGNI